MMIKRILILAVFVLVFVNNSFCQSVTLPRIFADHMVLQRDIPLRIWGWNTPNQKVNVQIDGIEATTISDANGAWELLLPPHQAGGPYELEVTSEGTVIIRDVLYGDVWLAGGQSNMEWKIGWKIDNWEEELEDTNYPDIRYYEVINELAPAPKSDVSTGEWVQASPETAKEFSAVAWFFAKHNHQEKKVPVGIIDSNWGGTPAEAWVDARKLLSIPGYKEEAAHVLDPNVDWEEKVRENEANQEEKWHILGDKEGALKTGAQMISYKDNKWQEVEIPTQDPLSDVAWLRKEIKLKDSPQKAQLYLGDLLQEAMIFVNGKLIAEEGWQDTTAILDIEPGLLKKGKNLVAVRVVNSWDNKVRIGKPGKVWLKTDDEKINLEGKWKYSNNIEPKVPNVEFYNWKPGFLYNAMIAPLSGYGLKGFIWYQGENNAGQHEYYEDVFKALITDWRVHWKQEYVPFLFVQLANYLQRQDVQPESDWAYLRDAQTGALELPNTGMATIIDIGVAEDIHPRNKQDVGKRLWLAARKVAYNDDIVYSGPMYKSIQVNGNKAEISFTNIGSGLKVKGDILDGFIIAGADGKFYKAKAELNGDKVLVSSDQVSEPKAVRYAWADNPNATLYNKEGLPAVPFKTD
ncbi:sialate O-acetylesterase [Fulvivirga maritima]|uniref:sialate O-acetylesterase n=1 Tax=Fulvivirga maritima TaxID=2904247 RepID=UPI001F2E797E|nr:sialate O-acetylesterase [Fulvivirga maritima]UII25315.1 sialate O-acetylesterase [Fulvivirga maritima]